MNFKLSFHGAAGTVTGSKYLLEAGRDSILIDCGLFQGLKELRLLNWQRPQFRPEDVGHVLLTHAHIDHSGYLPRLVREGFHGRIHCTAATGELSDVLLLDAAKLQEEDAAYANRKTYSKHRPALPLFTENDARHALRRFKTVRYAEEIRLGEHVAATYHNAGHILGAAFIEVRVTLAGTERTIVFSGDLGRYNAPLHLDPAPLPPADIVVLESTYGDELHDTTPLIDQVRKPFRDAVARGGTILIPAFAVARVQILAIVLRQLMDAGDLADVPIHIDSPMAAQATRIYRGHTKGEELDPGLTQSEWDRLLPALNIHSTVEESRALNDLSGPRIIIAPSGMMTGGRVLHHLERLLPREENLVVLAGYQAVGTRGRALLEGARFLRMHGHDVPVRAETLSLKGLSSHADSDELLRWLRTSERPPTTIFLTHGEPPAALALGERIERELGIEVRRPEMYEVVDLSHRN